MIKIYNDGSCKPTNPGPAGIGVVIILNDGTIKESSEYIGNATNNVAELKAFEHAIDILTENNNFDDEIISYSDSKYVIGVLSQNWKPKVNIDLINQIKIKLQKFKNFKFMWCKGHSGEQFNELADKLAGEAVEKVIKKML